MKVGLTVRWILVVCGVGLVSWALLTADLARDTRALTALAGGVVFVVGLAPARKPTKQD